MFAKIQLFFLQFCLLNCLVVSLIVHPSYSLTPLEEQAIGEKFIAALRAEHLILDDLAVLAEYIRTIGQRLTQTAGLEQAVEFFVINHDSINAFTMPGGKIGIHLGLMAKMPTEGALAAVLAHELAHVAQKHLSRRWLQAQQSLPVTISGIVAAVVAGKPELMYAVLAQQQQQHLTFSREHEQEADRLGMQLLERAGFAPACMPALFLEMKRHERYTHTPPAYLLTHPMYNERIADAEHRLGKHPVLPSASMHFQLMQQQAIVFLHKQEDSLPKLSKQLSARLASMPVAKSAAAESIVLRYALGLTYLEQRLYVGAQQELSAVLEAYPTETAVAIALAEVEYFLGQKAAALAHLAVLASKNFAASIKYVELLMLDQRTALAYQTLLKLKVTYPKEAVIYYYLVRAASVLKNAYQMHMAQAEWQLLHANPKAALTQLTLALNFADPWQQSQIKKQQAAIMQAWQVSL
jgi:predicted Zn-dependent protease